MEEKEIDIKKEKNFASLVSVLGNLYSKVNQLNGTEIDEDQQLVQSVIEAHEEWQSAEKFFHSVSDPDLVDHAIYKMEATKARYIYLLKQAKAKGTKVNLY